MMMTLEVKDINFIKVIELIKEQTWTNSGFNVRTRILKPEFFQAFTNCLS